MAIVSILSQFKLLQKFSVTQSDHALTELSLKLNEINNTLTCG